MGKWEIAEIHNEGDRVVYELMGNENYYGESLEELGPMIEPYLE
jgi:hypothetical protein